MRQYPWIPALISFCFNLHLQTAYTQYDEELNPIEQVIEIDNDEIANRINAFIPDESLNDLKKHPIDLNQASKDDIYNIPILSEREAQELYEYVIKHRPILSKYELQTAKGISIDLLKKLMPYITVPDIKKQGIDFKKIHFSNHSSLITRWSRILQKSKAYQLNDSLNNAYLGSPDQCFIKFKNAAFGKYSVSLMGEKDAGEPWFNHNIKGFDFLSGHISFESLNPTIKTLILGDYNLCIGQGLIIDNGFNIGKNDQFGSVIKSSSVIKPYQSLRESELLRGLACKLRINANWNVLMFYSSGRIDGHISIIQNPIGHDSILKVSSLISSGLHRSKLELNNKKNVKQSYEGLSLDYAGKQCKVVWNFVAKQEDPALSNENRIDRLFISEQGKQLFTSLHHQWILKNFTICGEWATDQLWHKAFIENALLSLGKNAETMISYRNFSPGFYSTLSNTISSSGLSWNERSTYFSVNIYPIRDLKIHAHADFTAFPWLRYETDLRTAEREYSVRLQYSKRKKWLAYLQFYRLKRENNTLNPVSLKEKMIIVQSIDHIRLHFEKKLNSEWTWRSRIEFHRYQSENISENGMMMSQDLLFKSYESRFSFNFRLAIFDCSDFTTRIYSYENDLMYEYSLPAYNGRGIRAYANIKFRLMSRILIETRLSNTYFWDENQNGSSFDHIQSSNQTEIKFQIQFHF